MKRTTIYNTKEFIVEMVSGQRRALSCQTICSHIPIHSKELLRFDKNQGRLLEELMEDQFNE